MRDHPRSGFSRRKSPLKRGGRIKRGGKVKPRNPKRRQTEFARAFGSVARVRWIKDQPCCITGERGHTENVHVRGGGAGRRADAKWIVPMRSDLHRELHRIGQVTFEERYDIDLYLAAEATEARWQDHLNAREHAA